MKDGLNTDRFVLLHGQREFACAVLDSETRKVHQFVWWRLMADAVAIRGELPNDNDTMSVEAYIAEHGELGVVHPTFPVGAIVRELPRVHFARTEDGRPPGWYHNQNKTSEMRGTVLRHNVFLSNLVHFENGEIDWRFSNYLEGVDQ